MSAQGGDTLQVDESQDFQIGAKLRRTPPCPRRVLIQLRVSTSYTYMSVSSPARISKGLSVSLSIDQVTALIWSGFLHYQRKLV